MAPAPGGYTPYPLPPACPTLLYPTRGEFWSWTMRLVPTSRWPTYTAGRTCLPAPKARRHHGPDLDPHAGDALPGRLSRPDHLGLQRPPGALTGYLGVNGRNRFKEAGGQDGMLYVNSGEKTAAVADGLSNTLAIGERPPSDDLVFGWQWAGSGK